MADLKFDNHAETQNDRMKPLVTGNDMSISKKGIYYESCQSSRGPTESRTL